MTRSALLAELQRNGVQLNDIVRALLAHPDFATSGSLTVASRPLASESGDSLGFYLRRIRGGLWLRGYRAPAEHLWSADDRFVFCRAPMGVRQAE